MNEPEIFEIIDKYSSLDAASYQYFNNLFKRHTIILNSEIDESILETVVMPLKEFEEDLAYGGPIKLILNTPGGSVADGLMICNVIDNYTRPLEIIVPSYACSMGTIILCSGNNNPNITKKAYPFSFALFHSGTTYVGGESTSVEDVMNFNKSIDNRIRDYVIKNTKITEEIYDAHHRKQWYVTAQEMKEFGLIDEIIGDD